MDWSGLEHVLSTTRLWLVALILVIASSLAAFIGVWLRRRRDLGKDDGLIAEGQEGYIVSAVLGLLALLTGFTFSLAVDRFDARRYLVLEEANAIGTAYLRAQILEEPHRTRMSGLLRRYTDNRIALGKADPSQNAALLAANDALIVDIWTATRASYESIKRYDFSSIYMQSVNTVIDLDSSRKAARRARVPAEVFAVLIVYLILSAGGLGFVMVGRRGQRAAAFLVMLFILSLLLIIDIDRPRLGGIVEDQAPMERLQASFATWTPEAFDRWSTGPDAPPP
ncbi:MAG TPA: hypothetical protein VIO94_13915 [Phenylobacterium sp.]